MPMHSIAIQAGGQSSRIGQDKAVIPLGGKRLIEHIIDRLGDLSEDLFITSNHPAALADLKIRLVPDDLPGRGALYGLQTALRTARYDHVLVVACDMPFIQRPLVDHMLSLIGKPDVIVPRLDRGYEPLLAIYRASACLPAIERSLQAQKQHMIHFFSTVKVHPVEPDIIDLYDPARLSFFNVNTPEDLQIAEQRLVDHRFDTKGLLDSINSSDTGG